MKEGQFKRYYVDEYDSLSSNAHAIQAEIYARYAATAACVRATAAMPPPPPVCAPPPPPAHCTVCGAAAAPCRAVWMPTRWRTTLAAC